MISRLQFEKDKDSASAKAMARVIFDTALLESGYPLDNPKAFNERVYEILAKSLNVKSDVTKGVEFDKSLDQVLPPSFSLKRSLHLSMVRIYCSRCKFKFERSSSGALHLALHRAGHHSCLQDEDAEDGEGESESNEEFIDRIVKEHKEKLEEEKDEL